MFRCIHTWKKLGRVYNIWVDSAFEKVFSTGHIFSGSSIKWKVAVCNLITEDPYELIEGEFESSRFISVSPESNLLASNTGNTVSIWDLTKRDKKHEIKIGDTEVISSFISDDGKLIFISSYDGFVYALTLGSGRPIYKFRGKLSTHRRRFLISREKDLIVAIDNQNTCLVKAWNYSAGEEMWCIDASHQAIESVMSITLKRNSNILILSSLGGKFTFWDIANNKNLGCSQIENFTQVVNISPDGKFLLFGSGDGVIRGLNLESNEEFYLKSFHKRCRVEAIAMLDEQRFVSAGWDGTLKLWARQS